MAQYLLGTSPFNSEIFVIVTITFMFIVTQIIAESTPSELIYRTFTVDIDQMSLTEESYTIVNELLMYTSELNRIGYTRKTTGYDRLLELNGVYKDIEGLIDPHVWNTVTEMQTQSWIYWSNNLENLTTFKSLLLNNGMNASSEVFQLWMESLQLNYPEKLLIESYSILVGFDPVLILSTLI